MKVFIHGGGMITADANDSWRALAEAVCRGDVVSTGAVEIPDAEDRTAQKQRRMMSRGAILAHVAVRRTLEDVGWDDSLLDVGAFLGVGASGGSIEQLEAMLTESMDDDGRFSVRLFGSSGLRACNPLFAFQLMNNFTLCHAAILEGLGGPNSAVFSRGSGTTAVLREAMHALRSGACERALAGGADTALDPVTWSELDREGWLDGVTPAEGAAVLALTTRPGDAIAELQPPEWRGRIESLAPDQLPGNDEVLLLARDATSRARMKASVGERTIHDIGPTLGQTLAAGPAFALLAAAGMVADGQQSVDVVTCGVEGEVWSTRVRRPTEVTTTPVTGVGPPARNDRTPVITGVGVVSPFGTGATSFFDALERGDSAVREIGSFDATELPVRVAAEVPVAHVDAQWLTDAGVNSSLALELESRGILRDRKIGFALLAALEAWSNAGAEGLAESTHLCIALGLERALLEDFGPLLRDGHIDWSREPAADLPPVRFRTRVDLAADIVTRALGLGGPRRVNVSACAAGALSVAEAGSMVARGDADVVLCGGADSMVNPLGLGGMARLGAPSPRNAPDACRPFDARRDGLVIGEGAAFFVVESPGHAAARRAQPIARLLGWGSTQDGYRTTAPRPDGSRAAMAMTRALHRANLTADDIDYVNAHGTGTPLNDPAEVTALREALGVRAEEVPTSSIKGAIGHLMAASGAIEIAASLLPFARGIVPGTAHLEERDPACDIDIVGPEPRRCEVRHVLSNSFGFGGQNATVVLGATR